jgi:hypothetical protein
MSKGLIDLKRANTPPENPLINKGDLSETKADTTPTVAPTPPIQTLPKQTVISSQTERVSTIGARIPESLHQTIKVFCITNRIEMQNFVQEALTTHLSTLQGKTEISD